MSIFTQASDYDRPDPSDIDHSVHGSHKNPEHDRSSSLEQVDEQDSQGEFLDALETEYEYIDTNDHSHSPGKSGSAVDHSGLRRSDPVWGRVPPESRAFKAAARTGYRPGDDWHDLPRDQHFDRYPPRRRPRGDHPLADARERLGHWLDDHLPATLQGRWRLDRRTGAILVAVLAVGAVLVGGWTLVRDRTEQVAGTRLITTGHHGSYQDDGTGGGDNGGSHGRHGHSGDDESGMHPDDPTAMPGASADASGNADRADGPVGPWPGRPLGTSQPPVIVDIEGKVARPGVQQLPAGSRVEDAVRAAGGALSGADLTSLNQARILNDGEQIAVGIPQDPAAAPSPSAAPRSKGRGKQQLSEPVHLNSATVDQLEQLPGVGPAMAQRILDWRTGHGGFATVDQLREVRGLGGQRFAALRQWVQL